MIGLSEFQLGVLIQRELESLTSKYSDNRRDLEKEKLLKEVSMMIKVSVAKAVSENNKAIKKSLSHL